jgi:hypothetical protein
LKAFQENVLIENMESWLLIRYFRYKHLLNEDLRNISKKFVSIKFQIQILKSVSVPWAKTSSTFTLRRWRRRKTRIQAFTVRRAWPISRDRSQTWW